jgi:hypothetical protein
MRPISMIINLDPITEGGSHWIAMFITNKENIYCFDSFGSLINCIRANSSKENEEKDFCLTGPNDDIYDFLKSFKHITQNKNIYQSIFSNNCAHFCIYFIYSMSIGNTFEKTLETLDRLPDPNYFVQSFVETYIVQ